MVLSVASVAVTDIESSITATGVSPGRSEISIPSIVVSPPGNRVSPLGSSRPPPDAVGIKEKPDGSALGDIVVPPTTISAVFVGRGIVVVPTTKPTSSRETVMLPMTVVSPTSSSVASCPTGMGIPLTSSVEVLGIDVSWFSGIERVPSTTRKELDSSREMVLVPMVVICPGCSPGTISSISIVVPPITIGAAMGAGVIGGSAIVLVPPTTTNPAELSREIGTSLIVVCWPGLNLVVVPLITISDRDGSITIGPAPGNVTIGGGVASLVGLGPDAPVMGGLTPTLETVGSPGLTSGRPSGDSWGCAGGFAGCTCEGSGCTGLSFVVPGGVFERLGGVFEGLGGVFEGLGRESKPGLGLLHI